MQYKYRAVFEFREVTYNPVVPNDKPRWAVIGVRRPYVWNWLGKPGQSRHSALTHYKLFSSETKARRVARLWMGTKFEDDTGELSTKIGNNEHLRGKHVYEVVEVIPCRIESRYPCG